MRKLLAVFAVVATAVATFVMIAPERVSADPAFVVNSGRDGLTCTLSGAWNGSGNATLVANDGGNVNFRCNGTVTDAPPPSAIKTTAGGPFGTSCKLIITPSGNFNANCH